MMNNLLMERPECQLFVDNDRDSALRRTLCCALGCVTTLPASRSKEFGIIFVNQFYAAYFFNFRDHPITSVEHSPIIDRLAESVLQNVAGIDNYNPWQRPEDHCSFNVFQLAAFYANPTPIVPLHLFQPVFSEGSSVSKEIMRN